MTDPKEVHMATDVVQDDDIEESLLKLGTAISKCSAEGSPIIAFSHAPTRDGGYNYAAVVHGVTDPNREVTLRDLRETE